MKAELVEELYRLMIKHKDVIIVTADMGFGVFEKIQTDFPDRFINSGVTEQASISFCSGLANMGYKVYFYAQASFATARCYEQIRLDVASNRANVKIIGANAGLSISLLGYSHFALDDLALMRVLPGVTVFSPGDPQEMKQAVSESYQIKGPVYLRFTKNGGKQIHQKEIDVYKAIKVKSGHAGTLFVTGGFIERAVELPNLTIYSVPTVKPLDTTTILKEAKKGQPIFTLEEHSVVGGLGSAIAKVLAESGSKTKLIRFGLPDKLPVTYGTFEYIFEVYNLSFQQLALRIRKYL